MDQHYVSDLLQRPGFNTVIGFDLTLHREVNPQLGQTLIRPTEESLQSVGES